MLFILVLILLAAAAGILGAVLKVTLIVVLSVVVLAWLGLWYAKRRMRRFQRDVEVRIDQARRRREAYDLGDGRSGSSLEGRS